MDRATSNLKIVRAQSHATEVEGCPTNEAVVPLSNNDRLTKEDLRSFALRQKENADRIQAIVDTAGEGIVTIGECGVIESFNPAAEQIFGYAAEEIIGKDVANLLPGLINKSNSCFTNQMEIGSENAFGVSREVEGCRKDGKRFPLEISFSQIYIDDRRVYTALMRDLTELKHVQAQLVHTQKMESVGHLAAGIAHEINTPIQYIRDNLQFFGDAFSDLSTYLDDLEKLVKSCELSDFEPELVCQIRRAEAAAELEYLRGEIPLAIEQSLDGSERVAEIVRVMKEFARPGAEEWAAVDLNLTIENAITIARNKWRPFAKVEVDFDGSLPLISCFPSEINHVVFNLIVNAAHAIEDSEGGSNSLGTITIVTQKVKECVELRFADTGIGIPEEIQPRVFDPFFTTKEVGRGTGQGLAVAYASIVGKHGGTIDFETVPNVGTTFTIRLPIHGPNG